MNQYDKQMHHAIYEGGNINTMKTRYKIRYALMAESLPLDQEARRTHKGCYIHLTDGYTRYELKGTGPECIVLVHGFSSPYFIYDNLFGSLCKRGYQVLRYDLIGRGLSDRPDAVYDADFFVKQLDELTDKLLPGKTFTVVGTSMGGIICTRFTQMHPEKVSRIILLAPAVMDTFKAPFAMKLSDLPVLGDRIFRLIAPFAIIGKSADELGLATEKEKNRYIKRFADFSRYKGYFRALASSLAHCILDYDTAMEAYRAAAASGKPMMVIWGTDDHTMPYYQIDRMKEVCPDACYVTYNGAKHIFVYDEAERTAWDMVEWMCKNK